MAAALAEHGPLSQEIVRIDVHDEPQIGRRFGQGVEPSAQVGLEVQVARCLHQQPPAVTPVQGATVCAAQPFRQ